MGTATAERKALKPASHQPEPERLPCPRCSSTNTKFCYYNNYNFSQPRHFCKSCRRYWTHGGTLRDIPVGGSSRKSGKRLRAAEMLSPDFRRLAPPLPERTPYVAEGKVCGSFTSLLNATNATRHGAGILALGGFALDEAGFGIGRSVWPTYGILDGAPAGGSAAAHTWHFENGGGDAGGFMGVGDYLAFPDLAISTPAPLLK